MTLGASSSLDQEDIAWIRLARCENVGAITFQKLLKLYKTPDKALDHIDQLAQKGGAKRKIKAPSLDQATHEFYKGRALGATFIKWGTPHYPYTLARIEGAPPFIWALGDIKQLYNPACAVVGSRNCSAAGQRIAAGIALRLGRCGYVTVSGMARGIDTIVHHNSLTTGTIGVLAGGLDVVYPPENQPLYEKIIQGMGVIISEMPFGMEPHAKLFPRRNRLISGLSLGVVVVEASLKSGSLVTARYGLEQGREIFAVPGSPLDPRSEGTNSLIKQGAILVQTSQDVTDVLDTLAKRVREEQEEYALSCEGGEEVLEPSHITEGYRTQLRQLLSPTPIAVDYLVQSLGVSASLVLTLLLELELAGTLQRHSCNRVSFLEDNSSHPDILF
jgi:DNA processing protein